MKICMSEIFNIPENSDVLDNSLFINTIDTDKIGDCDVIALVNKGREIVKVYPAFFVSLSKPSKIMVSDARDTIVAGTNLIEVKNIHEINGFKFTCVTLNNPRYAEIYGKYYRKDTWL